MSASGGAPQGAPSASALLASHVHAADLGETTIFLDLRRDRYFAAPTTLFAALARDDTCKPDACALRRRLEADGVLAPAVRINWPVFLLSCLWAERALAAKRLDRAVAELRRLRRRNGADEAPYALTHAFERARPWYPHRNVCLFDSLALMRFLLRCGARGELVFGVRGMPFSAHCWIETEQSVLNDEAEYCASFTPILRV